MNTEVALAINEGLVRDRESLKSWMAEIGLEITRTPKNHISVKNPNNPTGKPIVLRGEFYEQNFRHSEQSAELKREASERYRREADSRYANCIERYKKLCESKSEYHLERYAKRDRTDSTELTRQLEAQKNKPANQHRQDGAELERGHQEDARELTDSNTELETGLADVKRIEPNHSRASEAEKSTFFIEYSPSIDNTYFCYFEHVSRLRQQEQIQRHKGNAEESRVSEIIGGEHEYQHLRQPIVHSNRHQQARLSKRFQNSERGQLNDVRSTIIEDYRRSAASIEGTTAVTIRSLRYYQNAISDYRTVKELHEHFKRQAQRSSEDRAEISANSARTVRANYLSNFLTRCTGELENTVAYTFKRFSEELADREPGPQPDQARNTEFSASRDRPTIEANGTTNEREVRLSEQLSRKISGFDTENIFKALDEFDRRKELNITNGRNYDSDSPSPF